MCRNFLKNPQHIISQKSVRGESSCFMRTEWRPDPSGHDDFRSRYAKNVLRASPDPNTFVAVFWEVTPWTLVPTILRLHYPNSSPPPQKKAKFTAVKIQNLIYKLMDYDFEKASRNQVNKLRRRQVLSNHSAHSGHPLLKFRPRDLLSRMRFQFMTKQKIVEYQRSNGHTVSCNRNGQTGFKLDIHRAMLF